MKSPTFAAALAASAALMLALAACLPNKTTVVRSEQAVELHRNAPDHFVQSWDEYVEKTEGRYSVLAMDANTLVMSWSRCTSGCQQLFGNQNRTTKSLWANKTIRDCEDYARRELPLYKPQCSIYAVNDEIVWRRAFPWIVGTEALHDHRQRIGATGRWQGPGDAPALWLKDGTVVRKRND